MSLVLRNTTTFGRFTTKASLMMHSFYSQPATLNRVSMAPLFKFHSTALRQTITMFLNNVLHPAIPNTSSNITSSNFLGNAIENAIVFIKRTFQPSIIRKKRKMGFLVRQRTVGGRKVLKRRMAKGRWRLGGGI